MRKLLLLIPLVLAGACGSVTHTTMQAPTPTTAHAGYVDVYTCNAALVCTDQKNP